MNKVRVVLLIFATFALTSSALGLSSLVTNPSAAPAGQVVTEVTVSSATSTSNAASEPTFAATTTATSTSSSNSSVPSAAGSHGGFQNNVNSLTAGISSLSSSQPLLTPLQVAQKISILVAPASWVLLAGAWIWRGRVRARWTQFGFEFDVFELFMKMKGGATRIRVLSTLNSPKDRLQLAQELGLDWKAVDRHVQILNKYGFVREEAAYGTVRMYQTTPMGKMLLSLFNELEREEPSRMKRVEGVSLGQRGEGSGET